MCIMQHVCNMVCSMQVRAPCQVAAQAASISAGYWLHCRGATERKAACVPCCTWFRTSDQAHRGVAVVGVHAVAEAGACGVGKMKAAR